MNNNLVIQCILTVIGWIVVYILALRQNTQIKKKEVTKVSQVNKYQLACL